MGGRVRVTATVNGERVAVEVSEEVRLADFLRETLNLVGTRLGCEEGVCGSCTVLVGGELVRACLMLAVQVDGCEVLTVEGLADVGRLHPLQQAFVDHGAVQCGFCTPGLLITAKALLDENPRPTRDEIQDAISGNLCRCTGYVKIVDAVAGAAELMRGTGR